MLVPAIEEVTVFVERKLMNADPALTEEFDLIVQQTISNVGEKLTEFSVKAVTLLSNGMFIFPVTLAVVISMKKDM